MANYIAYRNREVAHFGYAEKVSAYDSSIADVKPKEDTYGFGWI